MDDVDVPLDVLCFGEALIDFFPDRTGVSLSQVDTFHRHLGGAPANVAIGLARLGVSVGLATLVGAEEFGRFVVRRLHEEGVDVSAIGTATLERHGGAKTGVTFVSVGARGERSFLFFRHPSADQRITPEDVDPTRIGRARVLHVGSSTLSREPARAATWKAIAIARAAGRAISTDPNFRPHLWEDAREARSLLERLVAGADFVKVSDDELEPLLGIADVEAGARAIRALGPSLVVVTLGARGCYYLGASPSVAGYLPGVAASVVDSTGAGDAFVAGVLAHLAPLLRSGGRIADADETIVRAACTLGNRMGALATTRLGATAGLPAREALARAVLAAG